MHSLACGKCAPCRYCSVCCEQTRVLFHHLLRAYNISCQFDASTRTAQQRQVSLDLLHARLSNLQCCSRLGMSVTVPQRMRVVTNPETTIDLATYLRCYPLPQVQPRHSIEFHVPIELQEEKWGCNMCRCPACKTCCTTTGQNFQRLCELYKREPTLATFQELQQLAKCAHNPKLPLALHRV